MQTGDIKTGMTFIYDGKIYTAVEWQHVCQPRLAAFIRARIKNVETGAVLERNFKTNENVEICQIERKEMEYLYNDNDIYYFMDMETYEQVELNEETIKDQIKYLKENLEVELVYFGSELIGLNLPEKIEYTVTYTTDAVKGNTSSSAQKDAELENGLTIKVPLFINENDVVVVSSKDGKYVSRK